MTDRTDGSGTPAVSRRRLLAACGAAALAGCPSGSGGTDDGGTVGGEAPADATPTAASEGSEGDGGATETTAQAWTGGELALDEKAGPPPDVTDEWLTFGAGLANTNAPDTEAPPTDDLGLYWRHYIEGQYSVPQPAVTEDAVYTGSGEFVYAFDRRGGTERWTTTVGPYAHNVSPTVAGDTVFVAGREVTTTDQVRDTVGTLYALDITDGSVRWETEAYAMGAVAAHDGTIYLPATTPGPTRGVLRALDAATGDEQWRVTVDPVREGAETGVFATPAVDPDRGTVYLTAASWVGDDERGSLHALDAADGTEEWRAETPGGGRVAPVLADGRVFVGDTSGRVAAFGPDGREDWATDVGDGGIDAAPVVDADRAAVYVTSLGRVARLDATSGEVDWTQEIRDVRRSGLAAAGGTVYAGGSPFLAFDAETGEVGREVPVDGVGGAYGQPVVSNGAVYVTTCIKQGEELLYDNYLYVVG